MVTTVKYHMAKTYQMWYFCQRFGKEMFTQREIDHQQYHLVPGAFEILSTFALQNETGSETTGQMFQPSYPPVFDQIPTRPQFLKVKGSK